MNDAVTPAGTPVDLSMARVPLRLWPVLKQGWRLWMRSPWALGLLALSPLISEFLLQQIPMVGMLGSKIVTGLLLGVIWLAFDSVARTGRTDLAGVVSRLRRKTIPWIVSAIVVMTIVFGFQVLAGCAIGGPHAFEWLVLGDMKSHPPQNPFRLLAIVPLGVIPGTLVMLTMPLVLLRDRPIGAALTESIRLVLDNPVFFLVYTLATTLLTVIALLTVVGLLPVTAWLAASVYVVYRALLPEREAVGAR